MPDQASETGEDIWSRPRQGLVAFAMVLVAGTITYRLLGLGWIDAYYQTVITVSTVGYTEVGDDIGPTYRIVSSVIILFGTGIALYTIGLTFESLMEGQFQQQLGRNRMERSLDQLEDHVVLCGWGQVGQAIAAAIRSQGQAVVVIDRRPEAADTIGGYHVIGDAADDATLMRAGVDRAKGLVVALDSDADNMYVTLSGRSLNPKLFIVARANSADAGPKLMQAGADRFVNPHEIGGNRMAALMTQPNVADFLSETMNDGAMEMRISESVVTEASMLADRPLGETGLVGATGITLIAVRRADGTYRHHPDGASELAIDDVLIALGTPEQLFALRAWMQDDIDDD